MDNKTQQLADGVWRVEVAYGINAFVLADDGFGDGEGLTIVDTGLRSGGPRLVRSIRMMGLNPRAVGRVLLSHWHGDHAGSAAQFARSSAAPSVHVGTDDVAIVAGRVDRPFAAAPPGWTTRLGRLAERLGAGGPAEPVPDVAALADGDHLDVAGGLRVVHAPGHTAGHSAFWLAERGVLLGGDAVFNTWATWRGPTMFCSAIPAIPGTVRALAALESGTFAVAHGPPLTRRIAERLERVADRAEGLTASA